jgi:thymidine phosphorylase
MDVNSPLIVVNMGIDTHQEPVVYMREDCHVCRSEGFSASSRVLVKAGAHELIASLNVADDRVLAPGEVGLSKVALARLGSPEGSSVSIVHAPVLNSLTAVRKKVYGHGLGEGEFAEIMGDISAHRYSDIEIASFLSACAGSRMSLDEIVSLTRAMVACGQRLGWSGHERIFDKHCIGGLPGNRTTPLVVAIVTAAGYPMPKTSSRAITSPAGTADTMETLCNVNLQLADIQRVVTETGGCLAWGGAVNLSPADDLLIRIERALDLDGEGQLIASVLSKKIAAGSTHAIIDIPVGPTAKVRSRPAADRLAGLFTEVGEACGLHIRSLLSDGSQPIGKGIGPAQEARDLLAVLQCKADAPADLRERALWLAANLLDLAEECGVSAALHKATALLDSGRALAQFERILDAQGGRKSLPEAAFEIVLSSPTAGRLTAIDCRKLARLAKLAGAPISAAAGLRLHARVGDTLVAGGALCSLYSDSRGERDYALDYYQSNPDIFQLGGGGHEQTSAVQP